MTKLCIHQAADTIGGNCIEIVSNLGERILLDAGRPLDAPEQEKTAIPQSLDVKNPVLGVFLSHAHQDHWGMLEVLPENWPIYSGKATQVIIELLNYKNKIPKNRLWNHWNANRAFKIGSFQITPLLIDHSAFDAYALMIEVDGQRIFYSGDFRNHGRKGKLTDQLISHPPQDIDVLIMEGTNLGTEKATKTEKALESDFEALFKKTKGRVFVSFSAMNIDRVVTIFRACVKAKRIFVPDLYTALVLRKLAPFAKIPQPEWNQMLTVVTRRLSPFVKKLAGDDIVSEIIESAGGTSARALAKTKEKWVIMARASLVGDYAQNGVIPTKEDAWVWSQWKGYLDDSQELKDYFLPCEPIYMHTSGHAPYELLLRFSNAMNPKKLIPVHGDAWKERVGDFKNIHLLENGEWLVLNEGL